MKRDVIIIGTGVAGMTAAVALAKEGLGVLALEASPGAGGLMRSFRRGGSDFPTGIHCVGSLDPGQMLWRCFKYLGILDRVDLVRMDADGFGECVFPGTSFRAPIGHEAFRDRLLVQFPGEKRAVDAFLADMKETTTHFPLYNLESGPERPLDEARRGSLQNYLDSLTACAELKLVLSGMNVFYGMPPVECPVFVHFLVLDSFLRSAWRVNTAGRPEEAHPASAVGRIGLAQAFEDRLKSLGGEIRCGARVASIDSANGQAQSVSLAGGERLEARRVIYTGHPRQLLSLCSDRALRPAFRRRLLDLPETPGVFGVAAEWHGDDCPFELRDTFLYQSSDAGLQYRQRLLPSGHGTPAVPGEDGRIPNLVYCSGSLGQPCERERSSALLGSCKPSQGFLALAFSPPQEWARWADSREGERPADYSEAKSRAAEQVLGALNARWPAAASRMKVVETFSPLTFRNHTLTPTGSAYGIKKCVDAGPAWRLAAETRIAGLFLAGQSVVLPGVVGTTISSIGACGAILGSSYLVERIVRESN